MTANNHLPQAIRIHAPARLHLGLLDLNGGLGRRFGSIGLAIDQPAIDLFFRRMETPSLDGPRTSGPEAERLARYVRDVADLLEVDRSVEVSMTETMPAHAGFGSGTQIALATATALALLNGRPLDLPHAANRLERGARSGIGLAAFQQGGFVVDGGRGTQDRVPPLLSRLPFPENWRIVLILDGSLAGVHGSEEIEAFKTLPTMPELEAAALCRLVMMRLMPAIAESDITSAGAALTEIQARIGDHFAPAQKGRRFYSPAVATALEEALAAGAAGVGQSSWGPTGFALVSSEDEAAALSDRLVRNCHTTAGLRFVVARGRNRGATIETMR